MIRDRRRCKEFIERQSGSTLVEEYYEKGISGFKKRTAERDVIQQAKEDALKGRSDVLLVFMFDRLGVLTTRRRLFSSGS